MTPQDRRILSRYAGVPVDDVARIERLDADHVRHLRQRHGRGGEDGQPGAGAPPPPEHLTEDDVDRMMRNNRSTLL